MIYSSACKAQWANTVAIVMPGQELNALRIDGGKHLRLFFQAKQLCQ